MADVKFTVDGKQLTAPAGTLLIDACKSAGVEIPAFCYYPGLSLQAACRMCVVRIEKMPKLQTACTTPVAEGMVVATETPEIAQARKATLQLLLGKPSAGLPRVRRGRRMRAAGHDLQVRARPIASIPSRRTIARSKSGRRWFIFDRPRCILCYRCVRMCGEGMDVFALGIPESRGLFGDCSEYSRGVVSRSPGACGLRAVWHVYWTPALSARSPSGTYRYKTRPWEMNHVSTVCTHCGDDARPRSGCALPPTAARSFAATNRDKSGINGDFLCNKGRYAFDFANNETRITPSHLSASLTVS
ncbi:MAG: 2Fe-2S iron-sulfur cluster-binding protein [Edaphobacter sp.]